MLNMKKCLKVILVLQLLAYGLATYVNPNAETIDFGSPIPTSRDQLIVEAAIKRGMDGEAVAELLRTRKPVVRTSTIPNGFTKTTTYTLAPDGSISSKSILKKRNRYVYNSGSIPDHLKNAPTGTVTRTFTDSDGNKVTQTVTVNKQKPATFMDTDDIKDNWFNKPFPSWLEETPSPSAPPLSTGYRKVTRTYPGPNGERRTMESWSLDPEPSVPKPTSSLPNKSLTNPITYIKPNADSSNVPNEPQFPPLDDINWPNFDSSFSQPWDDVNPDDWEILADPETTTKKTLESWTPKTWKWPEFPTHPTTTTTTAKPKLNMESESTTRKPLPNLEDFLRSQYAPPANKTLATTTAKSNTHTPKSIITTTPRSSTTTTKFIKIEDLPVVEVLQDGKPVSKNILKTLPPHLTPRTPAEKVLSVEHKHQIDEDIEEYTPRVETNIRTYSKTLISPEKPVLRDLDPQMQDILKKAGIVPEIEGDNITKTRTEPDGRIITTSYKVNTIPSSPVAIDYKPIMQHYIPSYPLHSNTQLVAHLNSPISKFLAKLGLTKSDINSKNGHYSQTFIDENGDILTATFVLSSPKGPRAELNAQPLK